MKIPTFILLSGLALGSPFAYAASAETLSLAEQRDQVLNRAMEKQALLDIQGLRAEIDMVVRRSLPGGHRVVFMDPIRSLTEGGRQDVRLAFATAFAKKPDEAQRLVDEPNSKKFFEIYPEYQAYVEGLRGRVADEEYVVVKVSDAQGDASDAQQDDES